MTTISDYIINVVIMSTQLIRLTIVVIISCKAMLIRVQLKYSSRLLQQREFDSESIRFGKISILSNVRDDPEQIYNFYKQREEIEQAFDAMKNELENDKSYLSDEDSLRGYFFISFLSLYLYYSIFVLIRAADLTNKLSVKDVLLKFSKVYKIVRGNRETWKH